MPIPFSPSYSVPSPSPSPCLAVCFPFLSVCLHLSISRPHNLFDYGSATSSVRLRPSSDAEPVNIYCWNAHRKFYQSQRLTLLNSPSDTSVVPSVRMLHHTQLYQIQTEISKLQSFDKTCQSHPSLLRQWSRFGEVSRINSGSLKLHRLVHNLPTKILTEMSVVTEPFLLRGMSRRRGPDVLTCSPNAESMF